MIISKSSIRLLKTLFPLLPRTSSSSLRSFIRKTILTELRVANATRVNLKLNRAMQAMLFRMVEQGADMDVVFDKGKKPVRVGDTSHHAGEDALWAVFLTKDLWKKGIWYVLECTVSFIQSDSFFLIGMTLDLYLSSPWAVFTLLSKYKMPHYTSFLIRKMRMKVVMKRKMWVVNALSHVVNLFTL